MLNAVYIVSGVILNALCIWCINLISGKEASGRTYLKYISGAICGAIIALFYVPFAFINMIIFSLIGALFGEMLLLFFFTIKRVYRKEPVISYYDDGTPAKFFITGDKHRNFSRVKEFCRDLNTRRKDVLIILGDTGFNYYDDDRDDKLKSEISKLNITLFCLHGNKENRPQNVGTYGIRSFCGGKVYYEPKYPNLYFAIDGEIYTFEGKRYMVVGGAHSVDKFRCLEEKKPFWDDEMPSDEIKARVNISRISKRFSAKNTFPLYFGANTIWYLQLQLVC